MLPALLAVFAAEQFECGVLDEQALNAWKLACSLAETAYADELEGWRERHDRCAARLLSGG
jgi:hypothetical protein